MTEFITWPVVGLVLGLTFLLLNRTPLATLINRIRRVGKGGLEAFDTPPPPPTEEKRGVDEFFRTYDSPILIEAEERIQVDLKNRNIVAPADREKMLVRALASAQIIQHFEIIHDNIWLSQVACLRFLNPRNDGASIPEIKPFYNAAVATFPNFYTDYSFDQWLAFLVQTNLVVKKAAKVHITVAGREFLRYLIAAGKSDPRHG
jgi:hypothetical protein